MKIFRILIVLMVLASGFYACVNKENETRDNAIDSTLQTSATVILESKLSELNAQSGQVIVMEVQTGQIKALVGLERKDSADYQPMRELLCTTAYWIDAGCFTVGCTGDWKR